jgi:hypothetical protein
MIKVKIRENSWLAKIAARQLKSYSVAMVIGKTIHLHNASKADFLENKRWVRHEVAHVKQYIRLGIIKFLILYLLESFNKGYENNRFEVDARQKERDYAILSDILFS